MYIGYSKDANYNVTHTIPMETAVPDIKTRPIATAPTTITSRQVTSTFGAGIIDVAVSISIVVAVVAAGVWKPRYLLRQTLLSLDHISQCCSCVVQIVHCVMVAVVVSSSRPVDQRPLSSTASLAKNCRARCTLGITLNHYRPSCLVQSA